MEALRGERFWKGLEVGTWNSGGWDRQLLDAALSRSNMVKPVQPNYGIVFPQVDDIRHMPPEPFAYRFEYRDGTKATIL